jgi:hypothetical protein
MIAFARMVFVRARRAMPSSPAMLGIAALLIASSGPALAQPTSSRQSVASRPGVTVPFLLIDNSANNPQASVILFNGGSGQLMLSDTSIWPNDPQGLHDAALTVASNFLVRERNVFAETHGFNVVVPDVPSDHPAGFDGTAFKRLSVANRKDISALIGYLKTLSPGVPVWLIGTSRGSTSAVEGALIQNPSSLGLTAADGVVLTSSVNLNSDYDDVTQGELPKITIPAMMVADRQDACMEGGQALTPPIGVNRIANGLQNSPDFRGLFVSGGTTPPASADPCGPDSYHGFLGLEQQVVDAIAEWITMH